MLFKNLKSGNFVEVKDASTVEMMEASPNYEKVTVKAAAPAPEAPKPAEKPAAKPSKSAKRGKAAAE